MRRSQYDGAVAQLGERYTGSVEVRGSIPLGSTIFLSYQDDNGRYGCAMFTPDGAEPRAKKSAGKPLR